MCLRTLGRFYIDDRKSLTELRVKLRGHLEEALGKATKQVAQACREADEAAQAAAAADAAAAAAQASEAPAAPAVGSATAGTRERLTMFFWIFLQPTAVLTQHNMRLWCWSA